MILAKTRTIQKIYELGFPTNSKLKLILEFNKDNSVFTSRLGRPSVDTSYYITGIVENGIVCEYGGYKTVVNWKYIKDVA